MLLPFTPVQVRRIALSNHMTLEMLRTGVAEIRRLASLSQASFVCRFLCEAGYGSARDGLFIAIDEAVLRAKSVGHETAVWRLDEEGYALMSEMLTLHDEQLLSVPVFELQAATDWLTGSCREAVLAQDSNPDSADGVTSEPVACDAVQLSGSLIDN
jgi:hypothetical protein